MPSGVFAMIGGSMADLLFGVMAVELLISKLRSKKLSIMGYRVNREDLDELARLYE